MTNTEAMSTKKTQEAFKRSTKHLEKAHKTPKRQGEGTTGTN
jgi:hypothetical protein